MDALKNNFLVSNTKAKARAVKSKSKAVKARGKRSAVSSEEDEPPKKRSGSRTRKAGQAKAQVKREATPESDGTVTAGESEEDW